MKLPTTDAVQHGDNSQALFQVYAFYRLGLSLIFATLFFANTGIGSRHTFLFLTAIVIYVAINALLSQRFLRNWQPSDHQLYWIIGSDILLLQLIAASSGATQSGIGILQVVSVAAGSLFLRWPQALVIPALATIAQLGNALVDILYNHARYADIFNSGWLGIIFFATCYTIQYLVNRMLSSEQAAEREAAYAAQLEKLNSLIIDRMQTGIAVLSDETFLLSNTSAQTLLGQSHKVVKQNLRSVNPAIADAYQRWKHEGTNNISLYAYRGGPHLNLSFIELDRGSDETLLFIEDLSKITQHAQQLKLGSLGQLTASIAHEIRNPLGAISHAAQLMETPNNIDSEDGKLVRIIREQAERVNNIIESVMAVSRGNPVDAEQFELDQWTKSFLASYSIGNDCDIKFAMPDALTVNFDRSQLGQIVANLLDNGLRYSSANGQGARALILGGYTSDGLPYLDVCDYGGGIDEEGLTHLFEPFYTTERSGSGLGLYICRELCEANQARLSYRSRDEVPSSCFRINFSHPDRSALASWQFNNRQMHVS